MFGSIPLLNKAFTLRRHVLMSSQAVNKTTTVALTQQQTDEVAADSLVWAAQNGLVMGLPAQDSTQVVGSGVQPRMVHAPISLVPTVMDRELFNRAKNLSQPFNRLMYRVSSDKAYLRTTLKEAAKGDPFTGRLLQMMNEVDAVRGSRVDPVKLIINRSDYMIDEPSRGILQVEINMIAASFACLSSQVTKMHKYTLAKGLEGVLDAANVPDNGAMQGLAKGIAEAHKAMAVPSSVVLMVVQPNERNAYDQQWLTSTLWNDHGVRVIRKTLSEIKHEGSVDDASGRLSIGGTPISVAYLRSGYAPTDYPEESDWEGRRLLELSTVCKCPDLPQQLSGTKRVQQDLCKPGVLERFLEGEGDAAGVAKQIRQCFAGQWTLEDLGGAKDKSAEIEKVIRNAVENPAAFVLKPQREGGGNNFYDDELKGKLTTALGLLSDAAGGKKLSADSEHFLEELRSYILMEKIRTPRNMTLFMREGKYFLGESISELGVYGVFAAAGDRTLVDISAGHLLRTKLASSNEGGVAAGYAVLDSPYLV